MLQTYEDNELDVACIAVITNWQKEAEQRMNSSERLKIFSAAVSLVLREDAGMLAPNRGDLIISILSFIVFT